MARKLVVATNPARKRRTAAQKAASLRNLRKARAARKSPTRRRKATRRRKNPARAVRRASTRRAPARRAVRRNPARSSSAKLIPANFVDRQLLPALMGGVGAVANNAAYSLIMARIPSANSLIENLRSGPLRHVGHVGSAVVMTYLATRVLGRRKAEQLGAGALTVVGYNVVRELAARFVPQIPLGAYVDPALSAYVPAAPALGYAGAGRNAGRPLPARTGSRLGIRAGLAAYTPGTRPAQLSQRGQLTQPDPFMAPNGGMEGYGDGYN